MRIAKYISNSGYCSRRNAEKLILDGKVYINNIPCKKPATIVSSNDKIKIENKELILQNKIKLWKLYKPIKTICTNKDEKNRKTIFDILPANFPRVISIGRLDYMSEGLILLTNNGDYARKMELPSSKIIRIYRICIRSKINSQSIKLIQKGMTINSIKYDKIKVQVEKYTYPFTWIIFKLKEGKNREIRNICKYFNWPIVKLIRIQYGSHKLTTEKPGKIEEVNLC